MTIAINTAMAGNTRQFADVLSRLECDLEHEFEIVLRLVKNQFLSDDEMAKVASYVFLRLSRPAQITIAKILMDRRYWKAACYLLQEHRPAEYSGVFDCNSAVLKLQIDRVIELANWLIAERMPVQYLKMVVQHRFREIDASRVPKLDVLGMIESGHMLNAIYCHTDGVLFETWIVHSANPLPELIDWFNSIFNGCR